MNGHPLARPPAVLALELHETQQQAQRLGIDFLQTELQLATAFLDLAETTRNGTASRRNMENAAKALDAVGRFIETLNAEPRRRQLLMVRTAELRARLSDIGLRLQANGGDDRRCQQPR